jgi:hypothetical protein
VGRASASAGHEAERSSTPRTPAPGRWTFNLCHAPSKFRVIPRELSNVGWIMLSTLWSRWPDALTIVQPDTVRCWRRQGWRYHLQWWHGRQRPGRPAIAAEIRALIRRMSQENVLRGAPRIQGELAKLGLTHHHCEVYGSTAWCAVADMAYLPAPSCLRLCCQWGVCGACPPSSFPVRSDDSSAPLVASLLDND